MIRQHTDHRKQTPSSDRSPLPSSTPGATTPTVGAEPAISTSTAVAADAVQREIESIKNLITEQTKTIASQASQMQNLTSEIESLKAKLG